ncbi:MAG: phosphoribosylanthranilate isomerase [Proteobacteria bacterium]|nr:phosphoribosylanthranilate isomerase [Pseudomonadota bacterium]
MSVKVKICGITTLDDATAATSYGADMLGFIFYTKSARYIAPAAAKSIIAKLPPSVTTVGVFVDAPVDEVNAIVKQTGINVVQLHGKESPEECARVENAKVVKAFRVSDKASIAKIDRYSTWANLLDTYVKGTHGGTGETFDWKIAVEAKKYGPLILSGGLTPDNISEAVRTVRPYAVDVSSGVESSPGVKVHELIKQFIERAKSS